MRRYNLFLLTGVLAAVLAVVGFTTLAVSQPNFAKVKEYRIEPVMKHKRRKEYFPQDQGWSLHPDGSIWPRFMRRIGALPARPRRFSAFRRNTAIPAIARCIF